MRAFGRAGREFQLVATRDAGWRVHEDGVADRAALGIERLLHDERPVVPPFREHRAPFATLEFQTQFPLPGGENRLRKPHVPIIPPASSLRGLYPILCPGPLVRTTPAPLPRSVLSR